MAPKPRKKAAPPPALAPPEPAPPPPEPKVRARAQATEGEVLQPGDMPAACEFTHPETGGPIIVNPLAVTHLEEIKGSALHHDPKKAAAGELEVVWLTGIGTVGGQTIKVIQEIEDVAEVLGM